MLEATQFRQYAEDAMYSARLSKSKIEQQGLMDLARIWSQAAMQSEAILGVHTIVHPETELPRKPPAFTHSLPASTAPNAGAVFQH